MLIKLHRASLYLYNPMVRGPWVDLYSRHYNNKINGRQPYDSLTNYALHAQKMRSFYIGIAIFDQNLGSKPQDFTWGVSRPTKRYCLPPYVPFKIIVHAYNVVVPNTIINKGASVSILSLTS